MSGSCFYRVGGNTADFMNMTQFQTVTPERARLMKQAAEQIPGLRFSLQLNWIAGVEYQIEQVSP